MRRSCRAESSSKELSTGNELPARNKRRFGEFRNQKKWKRNSGRGQGQGWTVATWPGKAQLPRRLIRRTWNEVRDGIECKLDIIRATASTAQRKRFVSFRLRLTRTVARPRTYDVLRLTSTRCNWMHSFQRRAIVHACVHACADAESPTQKLASWRTSTQRVDRCQMREYSSIRADEIACQNGRRSRRDLLTFQLVYYGTFMSMLVFCACFCFRVRSPYGTDRQTDGLDAYCGYKTTAQ